MHRVVLLVMVMVMGCASEPQVTPQTAAQYHRPLITDQLPFRFERAKVRDYLERHDWCRHRTWGSTDEFSICDPHPYLNQSTPPMFALVEYDATDRTTAYAVFTPVPCRMYGRCDSTFGSGPTFERDFVDHERGLRLHLAAIGESVESQEELPSMQERMVDALGVELKHRFGAPVWQDPRKYGMSWITPTAEIGMFVVDDGAWVVETHELHVSAAPGLTDPR